MFSSAGQSQEALEKIRFAELKKRHEIARLNHRLGYMCGSN